METLVLPYVGIDFAGLCEARIIKRVWKIVKLRFRDKWLANFKIRFFCGVADKSRYTDDYL